MRALLPIAGNQIVTLLLGLVGIKLISHFVPAALNGYYGLFVSLTQISVMATHSDLVNHATRYWRREAARPGSYSRFLWLVSWRKAALLAPLLLVILLARAWSKGEWVWVWMFPLLLISNLGLAFNAIGTGIFNADRKPWHVWLLTSIGTSFRVFLPVGLALCTQMNFWALSLGYTGHALLIIMCLVIMMRAVMGAPSPSPDLVQVWMRELKSYGRPFLFLGVGAWLILNVDRWIVDKFFDPATVGFFIYALSLGGIVPTVTATALMQAFFPGIFRRADEARTPSDWRRLVSRCDRLTIGFVVLSLGGLAALHFVAPFLTGWLIGVEYAAALPMIIPAGLAMLNSQINQFHYLLLQGQHNSAAMVRVMLVNAAIKTLGGLVAAAISWTAFLGWLIAAPLIGAVVGRTLILRAMRQQLRNSRDAGAFSEWRGSETTDRGDGGK